jgi:hypothetical protein
MLCESTIFEFVLEFIVVDMVLIPSSNKDHQIIVTIYWELSAFAQR